MQLLAQPPVDLSHVSVAELTVALFFDPTSLSLRHSGNQTAGGAENDFNAGPRTTC